MIKNQILLLALVLAIIGNGCASSRRSYTTLASIESAVDSAYKTYNDLIVTHKISSDSLPKMSIAYNTIQQAIQQAVVVAKFDPQAIAPAELAKAAADFISLIENIVKEVK